jgi:predicted restriction endonuclease
MEVLHGGCSLTGAFIGPEVAGVHLIADIKRDAQGTVNVHKLYLFKEMPCAYRAHLSLCSIITQKHISPITPTVQPH